MPDLDPGAIDRLDAVFVRIGRLARRRLPDDTLTFAQFAVMRILYDTDGPMAMGAIAEHLDISLAGATGIIDRLVQQGVVERTRSGDDRRVVWVALSPDGQQRMEGLRAERREQMLNLLRPLSKDEMDHLLAMLERIAAGVEARTEE